MEPTISDPIANGTIPVKGSCLKQQTFQVSSKLSQLCQFMIINKSTLGCFSNMFKSYKIKMLGTDVGNEKSEQLSIWNAPAGVQAAGPDDEPVVNSLIFHGFLVLPPNQMSSYASNPVTSFVTRIDTADFNLYKFFFRNKQVRNKMPLNKLNSYVIH